MRLLGLVLLGLLSPWAWANAEYDREQKWADEILPGIVVGDPVYLEARARRFLGLYALAAKPKAALVVVHGSGVHPDHSLIGVLRSRLVDAQYTTLSIQMPVLGPEVRGDRYYPLHPEATERIRAAVRFLQRQGNRRIAIVSHSQGSRMSHSYFKTTPDSPAAAWVAIGMSGKHDYQGLKLPVLDLFGEQDLSVVLEGAHRREQTLRGHPASRQVIAPNMDHFFTGYDEDLVRYVQGFLDGVFAKTG